MKRDLKILVTGKNRRIAKDISDHLETDRGYKPLKCRPEKAAIFDSVCSELPNVVIISMGKETPTEIKQYDILMDPAKKGFITVIVVATDEDRQSFMWNTGLEKMFFLSRPVSLYALYEKLNAIEEGMSDENGNKTFQVDEFINPFFEEKSQRKRVVIVDDDSEQLIQIKDILSDYYDVTPLRSGFDAFKFFEKHTADLILLDYLMPELDGPEVLKHLRTMDNARSTPVVFLTGVTEKNTVIKTITELKPQGYIVKPAKKSELIAKIIDVLG
ncbi:MAG: response regulator [Lachnospiraceae bacterium]|nr:response regulator [Lachnospiraceae bacterium]